MGVKPMSKTQIQTPGHKEETGAPIYTREELEEKMRELNNDMRELRETLESIRNAFADIVEFLYYKTIVSTETFVNVSEKFKELEQSILDAVDESIINELELDTDIDKYEREYGVKFSYETEKLLGVVMLKENETVRPVVIWTDYKMVDYYEGEKNE
jgi:hypothetical protein